MKGKTSTKIRGGVGAILLACGLATAVPAQSAQAATSPISTWPTTCNQWLEYQQFLYFFACGPSKSKTFGITIELLTFGGSWQPLCVQHGFIAKWDRGGYAGHRIGGATVGSRYCNWATSSPAHRQPGS